MKRLVKFSDLLFLLISLGAFISIVLSPGDMIQTFIEFLILAITVGYFKFSEAVEIYRKANE